MKVSLRRLLAIFLILTLLSAYVCTIAEAVTTLTLPSGLKIIEEEAFCGNLSIRKVIVPEGAAEIRSKAFAGSSLAALELPGTLTYIAEDAFESCGVLTIYGVEGSTAQLYAEKNDIDFCAIGISLPVPSITKIENWDTDQVRIEWNEVEGTDGVFLYRSTSADFSKDTVKVLVDGDQNSCVDSELIAGMTYYFRLQSFDCHDDGSICVSDFSDVWTYLFIEDISSGYDAAAAVEYARKWCGTSSEWGHEGYNNAQYYAYTQSNGYSGNQDCANFISQCLHAGGLMMDDVWYSNWKGSTAWINGYRLSTYLVDTLGYKGYEESQISISHIVPGDVVYTQRSTSGSHVMIVSKVEGDKVYCCGHTRNSVDKGFDPSAFVYHISMSGT